MLLAGVAFWCSSHDPSGHAVIWIEGVEITLFAVFWLIQTIERSEPRRRLRLPGRGARGHRRSAPTPSTP